MSSPLEGLGQRSRFSYRQLAQLASYSTSSPLRVIAHVDLDAFYAQCEMVRLGVPEDKPLAVQQWQGLIAVNYPARESGISRHCNIAEAKKLCPDLIAQHVATWREGDDKWAYRHDAATNIASDKVSLDPYRLQSRKILALVKDFLPRGLQRVEKASIDEVFLDLSAHVHSVLLERFPELSGPPPYDDPTEALPRPSVSALDWKADALVGLDEEEETQDPDWDDVAMLVGSEIVRAVRAEIRGKLGYTCSAGIASNKMLSKLGSGFKKPDSQTVVRSRAVDAFLAGFKLTRIRSLGGKLGDQVVSTFNTDKAQELVAVPLEQMKAKLGDETGLWLYNTVRGVDTSEVNSRTQIKSMLSAKSFRPSIKAPDQAMKWLKIFVADIHARLVEEGVLDKERRPRTMNLHHRAASGQARSRQGPIPQGKVLDEETLFQLGKHLLHQIMSDGNAWPCANLSLSVGGFEEGVRGNMGIGAFLVKGEMEGVGFPPSASSEAKNARESRPSKKPRLEEGGIHRFFAKEPPPRELGTKNGETTGDMGGVDALSDDRKDGFGPEPRPRAASWLHEEQQPLVARVQCPRCKADLEGPERLQKHQDWHMAKDLQAEERVRPTFAEKPAAPREPVPRGASASWRRGGGGGGGGGGGKLEQGQKKLSFG